MCVCLIYIYYFNESIQTFILRFPVDNKLLRGHWAHALNVDDGIDESNELYVCDAHFQNDDFFEENGITRLKKMAIPCQMKREIVSDNFPLHVETPTLANITMTKSKNVEILSVRGSCDYIFNEASISKNSSDNNTCVENKKHQLCKSTSMAEFNPKNKLIALKRTQLSFNKNNNGNNEKLVNRKTLMGPCKNKKTLLPASTINTPNIAYNSLNNSKNLPVTTTPQQVSSCKQPNRNKYKTIISDRMILRDETISRLRYVIKNYMVKKEELQDCYLKYLELKEQVLLTEEILRKKNIDTSEYQLFKMVRNICNEPSKAKFNDIPLVELDD